MIKYEPVIRCTHVVHHVCLMYVLCMSHVYVSFMFYVCLMYALCMSRVCLVCHVPDPPTLASVSCSKKICHVFQTTLSSCLYRWSKHTCGSSFCNFVPSSFYIIIIIMTISFVWAVATWWQGRLYIYGGNWYGTRAAADDEYEELGRSLDTRVLAGKCFLYMHVVRRWSIWQDLWSIWYSWAWPLLRYWDCDLNKKQHVTHLMYVLCMSYVCLRCACLYVCLMHVL